MTEATSTLEWGHPANSAASLPRSPRSPATAPEGSAQRNPSSAGSAPAPPPLLRNPWDWIAAIATQATRRAAVEHLVQTVASAAAGGTSPAAGSTSPAAGSTSPAGGGSVRMLWGTETSLRRIFDSRLGMLGTESSLWHEVAEHWARLANGTQLTIRSGGDCILRLAEPEGSGRALLWIASPWGDGAAGKTTIEMLERAAPAIAAVLWSRPAVRIPCLWRGARRMGLVAAAAAATILMALLPVPYRIHCEARVEAVRQRMIAAPFEATLLETSVQPGDRVAAGELLATLDGRPLRLELEALQADSQRAHRQRDAAMASGRIADAQLADLESRQLQRKMELLEQRLAGLEIRSPIDGVVVSGDLRKAIGSPLERGKPLLEIAPLRRMTIEIEVPERDIQYAAVDAAVRVRLDAAATEALEGRVELLYPAAEVRGERNVFVGQWEVDNRAGTLRPGMQGTAIVYGPRRPLAWPLVRWAAESLIRGIGW